MYKTKEEIQEKIDKYFKDCEGELLLDKDENPIEEIEGRVTAGSINIDGNSAVRRTCSLSMVAKQVNINDFYWGLSSKFKLLIGLKNQINSKYPDIIWFKLGTYVITSFNTSISIFNSPEAFNLASSFCLFVLLTNLGLNDVGAFLSE